MSYFHDSLVLTQKNSNIPKLPIKFNFHNFLFFLKNYVIYATKIDYDFKHLIKETTHLIFIVNRFVYNLKYINPAISVINNY